MARTRARRRHNPSRRRARLRNRKGHWVKGHMSRNKYHRARHRNRARHWVRGHSSRNRYHRYRRNRALAGGAVNFMRPMTWLPQVFAASLGAISTEVVPRFLPAGLITSPNMHMLAQGVIAAGGAMVLPMLGFRRYSLWWFVGGLLPIFTSLIRTYLLPMIGMGAYPYSYGEMGDYAGDLSQLPAYPPRLYGADAYPFQVGEDMTDDVVPSPGIPFGPGTAPYETVY